MPPQVEPPSDSKLKQAAEAFGDAVIGQVLEGVIDSAAKVISGAGELAADCGSAAVEAACQATGSVLDGL